MSTANLLMVAESEHDANMLYAVGMFVPDPFIYLRIDGRSYIVLNDLELDRGRRQARHCRVISLTGCARRLAEGKVKVSGLAQVVRLLAREKRVKRFFVPDTFPYGLARELRRLRLRLKVKPGSFFPERERKSAEEVKKISAALVMAEVGMAEGIQALKQSKIGPGRKLLYHNVPLTSEKLRSIINTAVLQAGGVAMRTIVACGRRASDPHEVGHGLLRPNQPIIIDIFPRSLKTGYYGDITRTVVKGRASESVRRLYHTVQRAQEAAFGLLRDQAKGTQVHQSVQQFFAREGYKTGRHNGRMQGFFHGTGHGLGLEIHEPPRISDSVNHVLRAGNVVTVEPGLYYPGVGGVRLEDVALITHSGAKNLTNFEKVLEV
jgi:Xaa-Pro aminopeptidase